MESGIKELVVYRFTRAEEDLADAKLILEREGYRLALNRSYYSIFHGMRAVNVLDGFDSSKHSGVIAHFNQYYVKTGIFPKEASKIIRSASEMREHADYEDFFLASKEEAERQVENAQLFLKLVKEYLIKQGMLS